MEKGPAGEFGSFSFLFHTPIYTNEYRGSIAKAACCKKQHTYVEILFIMKILIRCKPAVIEKFNSLADSIAFTILPDYIRAETGIDPYIGLLDKQGDLDEGNCDIIDELPLDYSILDEIDHEYPAHNAYFRYMTRGCPRNCAFCAVKTLEPQYKNYVGMKHQIEYVDEHFGAQKDLLLMDNNVFASKPYPLSRTFFKVQSTILDSHLYASYSLDT